MFGNRKGPVFLLTARIRALTISPAVAGAPRCQGQNVAEFFGVGSMKIARLAFPLLLVFLFLAPKCGYGQGFGSIIARKKVSLHRKLPAPIHISGKTLWVQVSSHDPRNLQVAAQLADILQTEILKGDSSLRMEPTSADVIIS